MPKPCDCGETPNFNYANHPRHCGVFGPQIPAPCVPLPAGCNPPVMFHTVTFPANLGDDTTNPPEDFDYRNVILVYAANGNTYIYSSDGIPTLLSNGDAKTVAKAIKEVEAGLELETNVRERETRELQIAINKVNNTSAQFDTFVTADASTVTLTKQTGPLGGNKTNTAMPLPVASATQAGVMNTALYNAVQENAEKIDALQDGAVALNGLPAEPTQEQLTSLYKEATGHDEVMNRASIYDITNQRIWYYYTNISRWEDIGMSEETVTVSVATNTTAGIVKGSTTAGQVAVEADGTMSLNGYDAISHDIDNLLELTGGLDTPTLGPVVVGGNDANGQPTFAPGPASGDNPATIIYRYTNPYSPQRGAEDGGSLTYSQGSFNLPMASEGGSGCITGTQVAKLNSLLNITELGDGLALSTEGVLSATGGGGGTSINVVQTTGESTADVMSQKAVSDQLALKANTADVNTELAKKVNITDLPAIPNVVQTTGTSETDVMSQKAVSEALAGAGGLTEEAVIRANNLPTQVFYNTSLTHYNSDNIEAHIIMKDLHTGGDATMTLPITAAVATSSTATGSAGVMSAAQATKLDRVPGTVVTDIAASPLHEADAVKLSLSEKNLDDGTETHPFVTISQATTTQAGVMTAADKVKVDQNAADIATIQSQIGEINTMLVQINGELTDLNTGGGVATSYTVTFDMSTLPAGYNNGIAAPAAQTVDANGYATDPNVSWCYNGSQWGTFVGWQDPTNPGQNWVFDSMPVTKNMTLQPIFTNPTAEAMCGAVPEPD